METPVNDDGEKESIAFKSYYVVWKLEHNSSEVYSVGWFKSYYVVWKLYFFDRTVQYVFCLNRTM